MLSIVNVSELSVMSDLQVEESWIEYSCKDELDNIRLSISRALGLPEPVLYEDHNQDDLESLKIDSKPSSTDWERVLNEVIELQERMATGMKMIQECEKVLESARSGKRIPKDAFVAWIERKKKLWNHWFSLKNTCMELIGEDTWLWKRYFSLCENGIDRTGYTDGETECPEWLIDFDQLISLHLDPEESVEE